MLGREDVGVDFGTSTCLAAVRGRSVVLREAALCALDRNTRNIIAVGDEALRMLGKTPGHILLMRPLKHGSVSDYDVTTRMLRYYLRKVQGRRALLRPRVFLCVPGSVTDVEKRSVSDAMLDAGARRTQLIDNSVAAAIGAGLDVTGGYGHLVVDVGGGLTDIAIVSMGRVVVRDSTRAGGDRFHEAIMRELRRKHNLMIGERTAEELKTTMGSAIPRDVPMYMDVTGRNLILGLPRTVRVNSDELTDAIDEPIRDIIEGIHSVLEHTPPELAADVFERGMTLVGGGAMLAGLAETLSNQIKIPCRTPNDPTACAAFGLAQIMDNLEVMTELLA
ncbi:MAG: rod shape-determining protein [Oscillospiraceae bacterium]|nr:rod shape-determining protein [Oscillospiraceae bacterium]